MLVKFKNIVILGNVINPFNDDQFNFHFIWHHKQLSQVRVIPFYNLWTNIPFITSCFIDTLLIDFWPIPQEESPQA